MILLFNFHMFVNFPSCLLVTDFFLQSIVVSKDSLCYFNLLKFVRPGFITYNIWSALGSVLYAVEENVYSAAVGHYVLYMSIWSKVYVQVQSFLTEFLSGWSTCCWRENIEVSSSFFFFLIVFIYLAVWDRSCNTQDLLCFIIWNLLLRHMDSLVVAHELRYLQHAGPLLWWAALELMGSEVVACQLSCSAACEILITLLGIEPLSPAWQGEFLTTRPPGKFYEILCIGLLFPLSDWLIFDADIFMLQCSMHIR